MSAVLPLLPSIRAKEELEQSASAQYHDRKQIISSSDAHSSQSQESKEQDNVPIRSANISSDNIATSNTPYQNASERSEQLDMIHSKEHKVFGTLPPLDSSVTCNAIHQYISTTSAFLNSFIANANASHEGIDHKLTVLEKQMSMLESKLASVPGLFPDESESDLGESSAGENDEEEEAKEEVEQTTKT